MNQLRPCLLIVSALLAASLPAPAIPTAPRIEPTPAVISNAPPPLVWHTSLKPALLKAAAEYQPALVLFSTPACPWCLRLKAEMMDDPDTHALLQHFALVEIDAGDDPEMAAAYQIAGVPTLVVLSAGGDVQQYASGYRTPQEVREVLKAALNPEFLRRQDPAYSALMKMLADQKVPADQWPDILTALGSPVKRKTLHDAILGLAPFPKQDLAGMLRHPRLAVRLGALEILEEMTGDAFGFDPWLAPGATENQAAADQWSAWVSSTNRQATLYATLTQDQINAYIRDLISDHPDRARRARQMLHNGGPSVAGALAGFLEENPGLPPAAAMTVKEVQYANLLAGIDGSDPHSLAHHLVFGSLDVRQSSIPKLMTAGAGALVILQDFLNDPDPMLREAAIDTLIAANSMSAPALLEKRLKVENDPEVVCAMLRGLGRVKSKRGLAVLISYLDHANEDLAVTALNSVTRLKAKAAVAPVEACLKDPRWRVRVAALEAIGALKTSTLTDKVVALLNDPDEFARYTAVKTLSLIADKKAAPKLEKVFLKEDGLKGAVVAAFVSMELPLPASFKPALAGKNPEVLLSVIEAIDSDQKPCIDLASDFINHENPDVACAAIRIAAAHGMKIPAIRARIVETLISGSRERKLAALEAIPPPEAKDRLPSFGAPAPPPALAAPGTNPPAPIDSLFDDFLGAGGASPTPAAQPAPATPAPAAPQGVALDDILTAFSQADAGRTTGGVSAAASPESAHPGERSPARYTTERLLQEVDTLRAGSDPEISFRAALLLTRYGSPAGLAYLQNGLAERSVAERLAVADSLDGVAGRAPSHCLRLLLNDPADTVRQTVIASALESLDTPAILDFLFEELLRRGTRLKPYELYTYELSNADRNPAARQNLLKWARRLIAESTDPETQDLGIFLLEGYGTKQDAQRIRPFLQAENPFLRRAAYHALGKLDTPAFTNLAGAAASDSSEYVRTVVPDIYNRGRSQWINYFDLEHFSYNYSSFSSYDRQSRPLPPDIEALLFRLTRDASPKVRIEAFFSLLENRKALNLAEFAATIDSFPDRMEIRSRVTDYLSSNFENLGKGFGILLRYLDDNRGDSERFQKIRKHFDMGDEEEADAAALSARLAKPSARMAVYLSTNDNRQAANAQRIKMVFFTSAGCADCARVKRFLPELRELFPWLDARTHDLRTIRAMKLNEALCERFGVPDNLRLVSPAVFANGGFLIKKDITFERLADLLARSATMSAEDWLAAPEVDLAAAGHAIARRYAALSPLLVAGSGFLDGINPCAFATLIFLVSYLQIARHKPRETVQVAAAFISGVFLAYLGLGLGLAQIISRMMVLNKASLVLNWGLAALVLVLMVLNIRDGILCLQGRLAETALQLPAFLKKATHIVIRRGARHARFVVAAFIVGLVISLLELACTGQVYAPTIGFIVQTQGLSARAVGLLILYNAAFILPLIAVFTLVLFGLTAGRMTLWLQRHAAAVKFGTAGLFLALFILFFIWAGPR